jgi:ParB-like chromosome segregation protein Spo0J
MELQQVKIDDIKIPEVRVTARFNPELWEQFQAAYKDTGQLDPILLYQVDGELWLCDGLHRLIEAKSNGETEILSVVMPGDLADVFTKNIMLDHLHGKHPVSEMVRVIQYLWKELDLDSDAIVEKTHLTREYVERLQKISELTPWCLDQLDQERIGVGIASALTKIKDPVRQETVCNQVILYKWTIPETEAYIREVESLVAETAPEPASDEPRPTPTIKCNFCHDSYELGQIANPNICSQCAGILFATIAEAERQFKAEQEAKTE